jgi:uncharacterized damage-inducible protein DinB
MADLTVTLATALIERYTTNAARVRELAAPIGERQFWHKPFPFGNSVGHLVLHLTGNLSYYIGTQIAGTGYVRDRPREFTEPNPPSKEEALARFDAAVAMVVATIRAQTADDWGRPYTAVGEPDGNRLSVVLHCAGHIQHHTGQMIYLRYQMGIRDG